MGASSSFAVGGSRAGTAAGGDAARQRRSNSPVRHISAPCLFSEKTPRRENFFSRHEKIFSRQEKFFSCLEKKISSVDVFLENMPVRARPHVLFAGWRVAETKRDGIR